jgi:hypothetical protein
MINVPVTAAIHPDLASQQVIMCLWMHACPNTPPHDGVLAKGSSTVYVNGKAIARIGDPISCGSKTQEGSQTIFAG